MTTTAEEPKLKKAGYTAVEAILHEHTRDIAKMEGDLAQLGTDVNEMKGTNTAILNKLDRLVVDLARTPQVPSLRDIAANVAGIAVGLAALVGVLMWWNAVMFSQYAKPIESALAITDLKHQYELQIAGIKHQYELQALSGRITATEGALQFKPSLRDWAER